MDIKQQILHLYRVEERSMRDISRTLGVDRKTVTRLINAYEAKIQEDPESGIDEFLAQTPKYKKRQYAPRIMKVVMAKQIDTYLKENDRRRNNGMRKQCMKRKDIHRALLEKGFAVSYSSVCTYIRNRRSEAAGKSKDVYLRIHHEPGVECEFDWGEVKLFFGGKCHTLMMAVFAFPYSKGRFAYLFHRQDSLAFMESHRNFFKAIGGVPCVMVYDNMRVAVVFDNKAKKPTAALQRMSNYYKFEWRFCNARAGWEKGNVERSVDYVRGRAFATRTDFEDIGEAQAWLTAMCDRMNTESGSAATSDKPDRLKEELSSLKPYPGEFGCYELSEYKADKQATICIKNNHYSVPETLAGKSVIAQLYSEKIVIFDDGHKKVATHIRSYGTNEWIIDINHYIQTLMRKTAAIPHSEAFLQMPHQMQDIFHRHFKDNGKEFLTLVKYVRAHDIPYDIVVRAAALLRGRGLKNYTADHIKVAIRHITHPDAPFREDQKNDDFIEIETGSEDILSQLEITMEKGTKLPKDNATWNSI